MAVPPTAGDSLPLTRPLTSFEHRRVGPYVMESELGRGGMGCVWLARRNDGQYEGRVAIKLLAANWLGKEGELRFRQEGTLLARLDHPNIARLLDAGVTDLSEPYLVLEYVEGESIDSYCNRVGLDVRARIALFLELLSAVTHAHRNLIVHRDIKPANVLVNADGKVKLLDFGISKLVQDKDPYLTRTGHTLLTPQYAAPEQLMGDPVTTATDIYALGLLLYLLLTGRLPYAATTSPAELMRLITTGSIPLPSSVATTTQVRSDVDVPSVEQPGAHAALRRQLRGDLDNIVLKAVHATPEQRYQDVPAFEADLRRYLNHEPVSARAATPLYRIGKFLRRNRRAVAATFLVVLSTTLGSVFSFSQWLEARRAADEARVQGLERGLINDFIHFALNSDGGPDREPLTIAEHLERSAASVEQRYADNPGFAGRLLQQLSEILPTASDAIPLDMLRRANALGRKANDRGLMAATSCAMARRQARIGRLAEAAERLRDARASLVELGELNDESLRAECLLAEAVVVQAQGNRTRATELLREAVGILERAGPTERGGYAELLTYLSSVYFEDSKFGAAIEVTERAMQIEREIGVADSSSYLDLVQNLAVLRLAVGEVGVSLEDRERLNELARQFYAEDKLPFSQVYNYGITLLRMERPAEALAVIERHIERVRAAQDPAMLMQMLHAKLWAQIQLRDWAAADRTLSEARPLLDQNAGRVAIRSHFQALRAMLALARQDAAGAQQLIATALTMSGYNGKAPERSLARVLLVAAEMELVFGRAAAAEKYANEALRLSEAVARNPQVSADVGEALLVLAKATAAHAPPEQLRSTLERAAQCLGQGLGAQHPLTLQARGMLEKI